MFKCKNLIKFWFDLFRGIEDWSERRKEWADVFIYLLLLHIYNTKSGKQTEWCYKKDFQCWLSVILFNNENTTLFVGNMRQYPTQTAINNFQLSSPAEHWVRLEHPPSIRNIEVTEGVPKSVEKLYIKEVPQLRILRLTKLHIDSMITKDLKNQSVTRDILRVLKSQRNTL